MVVNTPGTLILSPDVFPKNKLPETVKFPLTNILDALTSPDKESEPEFISFNLANVIGVVPNATCKEPDPLCKYISPSVNDTEPEPLLI